jgi:ankyrin repeat protein
VRSLKIKQILIERKLWLGAEGMQCLVRRKIARCRVNRVRLRRLYLYLFASATTIQGMIRKFLARVRVRSVRKGKAADAAIAVAAGERQREKEEALAELAEAKELLEGADIFAQARAGRAVDVEDIYTGRLSDEKHEPNEVDENSDTVLTIAAAKGFVDIVRKCFQWAFDFNHRNADGLTALMLAVQNNHLDVVQYILVPPVKYQLDRFTQEDSSFLLVHALESEALQRHRSSKYLYSLEMFKALMNQSLQLKEKDPISGTTPLHAACGLGDIETFRLCIKNRAVHDMVDDAGQLPLHRACTSSIEIAKMLLGIDASAGILLPDSKRAPILLTKDVDGKDCRLYAAIYGQSKILKFVTEVVAGNRDAHNASKKAPAEDVGWTPEDFSAILRLASGGNVPCFSYVAECGFDPTWGQQDTDVTVAMLAAERGQLAFLDFLLARKTDLTAKDKEGRTVMHYAAQCADEAVVAHLLSHADAAACGLSQMALAGQDVRGRTPLHVAAANNVAISVDLLAGDGLEAALRTQDKCGMSPLSVAAQRMHLNLAASYLQLEAPVALLDTSDHGVMWHLFHPNKLRAGGAKPIASELRAKLGLEAKLSKSAREANASLLAADIKLVVELARRGCPLYQSPKVTTEELLATPFETIRAAETPMTKELLGEYCPGDLLVQELCVGALGALVEVASLADCWRLLLSSIRYDDGTGKAFVALLEAGLADRLAGQSDASALRTEMTRHTVAQLSTGVYFGGLSVAGWCIRLGNAPLLQRLYKKGLDPSHAADVRGDSCLHVIARFGTPSMVDLTLSNESVVVEGVNAFGRTALMEAAKASNFSAAKRLVGCQASARRGLGGKYWGWLLALAHKQERVQINSQTGRIGDDDTTYFPAPEPSWYEEAMDSSIVSLQRK